MDVLAAPYPRRLQASSEAPLHHVDALLTGPDRTACPVVLRSVAELGPVFERNPFPALVVDHATLALRAVNDAAIRDYGWSRSEFLELTALDLRPEEDVPAFLALVERGLAGEWRLGASGTWRHRRRDGSTRNVVTAATPCLLDGRSCSIVFVHEVGGPARQAQALAQDARRSVAREVHDEIGQLVTALRLLLDASARATEDERAALDVQVSGLVDQLAQAVHDLCASPRPAVLDAMGLGPALEAMAARFAQARLEVHLSVAALPGELPGEIEVAAYRIVQEALTNVARHAGVREASVILQGRGDRMEIHVRDAGVGFHAAVPTASSSGVGGMSERARLLGGGLAVTSRPGHGTSVDAWLPLRAGGGAS